MLFPKPGEYESILQLILHHTASQWKDLWNQHKTVVHRNENGKAKKHLLFVHLDTPLVFNADGRLIEENAVINGQAKADESCSTMLNGEAIIFGGRWGLNYDRQVHLK